MSLLLLPNNINWQDKRLSHISIDDAKLVVSILYQITLSKKKLEEDDKYWFEIEISSQKWIKLLGKFYNVVLTALQDANIIGRSKFYRISTENQTGKSKSHWLCEPYRNVEVEKRTICEISYANERRFRTFEHNIFLSQYNAIEKTTQIPFSVYDKLRKNVQKNLIIEIEDFEIERLKHIPTKKGNIEQRLGIIDENIIYMYKNKITPNVSIGVEGQRFFSPLTQIYRMVRPYFRTAKNEHLIEHDIVSSQPIFVWTGCVSTYGNTNDTDLWKSYLENGTLYEYFMKELNIHNRDFFKSAFWFKALYGPVKRNNKLWIIITKTFPTIAKYMLTMKSGYTTNKELYKKFVIDAQIRESTFVLGCVCRNLFSEHRDIPLYTIHDSILTTKEYSQDVIQMLISEFGKLNIRPMIKTKVYEDMI